MKAQCDNNCYFHIIVYLLTGSQDQHFAFGSKCVTTLQMKNISNTYLINMTVGRMKLQRSTWGNEVTIFTTAQLIEKDVAPFLNACRNVKVSVGHF